jgi:hypothetical protein
MKKRSRRSPILSATRAQTLTAAALASVTGMRTNGATEGSLAPRPVVGGHNVATEGS